jgi:hypothetical protein
MGAFCGLSVGQAGRKRAEQGKDQTPQNYAGAHDRHWTPSVSGLPQSVVSPPVAPARQAATRPPCPRPTTITRNA